MTRPRLPKYFSQTPEPGFVALYSGKTIIMIGYSLLGIFLPIFLYEVMGYNAQYVLLYYAVASLVYALAAPIGASTLKTVGYRTALAAGVFFGATLFASMFFITPENLNLLIPFSVIVFTLYRIFYWIPYHVAFAKISDSKNRGKQLALIDIARNLIGLVIPIFSGFIVSQYNYDILFMMAIFVYLLSMVPNLMLPPLRETFKWSYADAWRKFFMKKNRGPVLAFLTDGADSTITLVVWPIFIFEILDGNYFEVGAIATMVIGVVIVMDVIFGKIVDKAQHKGRFIRMGSILYSIGYVLKFFLQTGFQVFIFDTYQGLSRVFMRSSYDTLRYDIIANEGEYVDEFVVLHEIAVHVGRLLMCCAIIIILFFAPLRWAFLLSAVIALFYSQLRKRQKLAIK